MKKLGIRKPKKEDLDVLITLSTKSWDYHHKNDPIWSSKGKNTIIKSEVRNYFLTNTKELVIVLTCDNLVVGYATAGINKKSPVYSVGKIGHIGTVFIDSKHRKLGLGKMAIDHFMKIFKKNKIKIVTLNVDVSNKIAVAAWKHMGFKDWRLELRKSI